ncbi:hypothetical protein ACFFRR_001670 [Megaselia abdita]
MDSKFSSKTPRKLLDMTKDEKLKFLNSFDLVLSDLDGVLWNQSEDIRGAGDGFNALKLGGKKVAFVTNNSVRSPKDYVSRFHAAGVDFNPEEMVHPLKSIIDYLNITKFEGRIYCIANELFKNSLKEAGYDVIEDPSKLFTESFSELGKYIFDKEKPSAVIVDVDFNFSGAKFMRAHQYLTRYPDCKYIVGASDKILPIRPGVEVLGPGRFQDILTQATNRTPIALGKPGLELSELVLQKFDISESSRVLMIGDMLEQDIGFGKNSNFQTLLVMTGGTKDHDLEDAANRELIPDFVTTGMVDFVDFFAEINSSKI